jgi:DNA repair exonuclease SbcCD ATPase subunit
MRVVKLHSENIKRIKAVDITPEEDCVVISGLNGAGKTSVIDSIWLALEYRKAGKSNPNPLRAGQNKGEITIDIGDYIVTRKFSSSGNSTLEVRTPEGNKVSSPQKLLDGFIGDLSFDPWEFSRKKPQEQREILGDLLFKLTNGEVDLANFDVQHGEVAEQRKFANKERARLAALIASINPPTDQDPKKEVSVKDLTESLQAALITNKRIEELKASNKRAEDVIDEAKRKIKEAEIALEKQNKELETLEPQDVEFLQKQLTDIETLNARAREVVKYNDNRAALRKIDEEISGYKDRLELIAINKAEALEQSPLPVKGLSITADGVMVESPEGEPIPFCQASAAQRLRISLGIAIAANPDLRVIRISDGSLLDDTSMQIIKEMAADEDFQVWLEFASRNEDDRIGVYIEDGQVVHDGQVAPN